MGDVFKIAGYGAIGERRVGSMIVIAIRCPQRGQGSMKLGRRDGKTSLRYMELSRFRTRDHLVTNL
jgi:hypothetical protein